jgi:hypothetical protein
MNSKKTIVAALAAFCGLFSLAALGAFNQDPSLHWRTLYSEHFAIHFHDGEAALAQRVADIAEGVNTKLSPVFHWQPQQRVQVVLSDRVDFSNGAATPLPRNEMQLYVTPPNAHSVIDDYDDWLELLITHEYTHILHLDKASGFPLTLRGIFGRQLFLFPNLLQPPWVIEGLATYEETDTTRGVGRGQNSLFRMLMRLEVANGIKPLRQANQPLVSWPMNTVRYLYGVYFFNFIAERYGEEKIRQLVDNYSNNVIPFMINSNSRQTLGEPLDPLWQEFETYLRHEFQPEITAIHQAGEVAGQRLTSYGYMTGMPQAAANGDLYFYRQDMASEPRLMRLRHGTTVPETVAEVHGAYFDLHPTAGIVTAEVDAVHSTNWFSDLYHVDPASGDKTQLTHGARYLYAAWSPDGTQLVAVHNAAGQSALHLLAADGTLQEVLWQGDDDTVLGPPNWSPDGRQLVAAVWRRGSLWNLESFDVASRRWRLLTHGPDIETMPRFTPDGKALLFAADYGGVFNIQRLDLASGKIATLTNVVGGAFAPSLGADGQTLYYMGAHGDGYDVYRLALPVQPRTPHITAATPGAAPPIAHTPVLRREDYNALPRLAPTAWLPYLRLDNNHSEIGISTWGSDPLLRHSYNLLAAVDVDNHWLLGRLDYIYDRWNPTLKLSAERQYLDLLDNNGSFNRFRRDDTYTLEAIWPFLSYERQWTLHAGLVSETETDQDPPAGQLRFPAFRDQLLGLAVRYNSSHRYPRAISPSHGRQLRLVAEDSDALASDYSGQIYTLDWREYLGLPRQHVLAARVVGGWGTEAPRPFRLGGSLGNGLAEDLAVLAQLPTQTTFGRRRYPLRGYPEGRADLRGRRMALVEAEWRFPIALVERGYMAPPIGLHRLHGSLFYDAGEAWDRRGAIPALRQGAGLELTAELILGYWLPLDLRLGLAKGFDQGGEEQAYLQVGASF